MAEKWAFMGTKMATVGAVSKIAGDKMEAIGAAAAAPAIKIAATTSTVAVGAAVMSPCRAVGLQRTGTAAAHTRRRRLRKVAKMVGAATCNVIGVV